MISLAELLKKPGMDWLLDEKKRVLAWVYENRRLAMISQCRTRLPQYADRAEDLVQDFLCQCLESLFDKYDPAKFGDAKAPFLAYLKKRFGYFLEDVRKDAKRRKSASPQPLAAEEPSGRERGPDRVTVGDSLSDDQKLPESKLKQKLFRVILARCARSLLRTCADALTEMEKEAVFLCDVLGIQPVKAASQSRRQTNPGAMRKRLADARAKLSDAYWRQYSVQNVLAMTWEEVTLQREVSADAVFDDWLRCTRLSARPLETLREYQDFWMLDRQAYGLPGYEDYMYEVLLKWWQAFPCGLIGLFQDEKIIGGMGLWPLSAEAGKCLAQGRLQERDLQSDMMARCAEQGFRKLYVGGIVIMEEFQNSGALRPLIWEGIPDFVATNQLRLGFPLDVFALGTTEKGQNCLRSLGFRMIQKSEQMPDNAPLFHRKLPSQADVHTLLRPSARMRHSTN